MPTETATNMRSLLVFLLSIGIAVEGNTQALSLTATLSDHNGYNISCFGARDGAIDIAVTGGAPPYTYEWSNSEVTEDQTDLAAGFYSVRVIDSNNEEVRVEWTLTEPQELKGEAIVYVYPNGYNVSCNQCFNGSIAVLPFDGVGPYTYSWRDGVTAQNRSSLGAVQTHVTITDANACEWRSEIFTLTSPERTDWTMSGNANTNPATQYIGTSDNKDLVFRANGTERFRLLANGQVKFTGLGDGFLKAGGGGIIMAQPSTDVGVLQAMDVLPFWSTSGNLLDVTNSIDAFLGTRDNTALRIRTNNIERMYVDHSGKVGVGEGIANSPLGGVLTIRTGWNDWLSLRSKDASDNDLGTWHFQNPASTDRLTIYYEPMGGGTNGGLTLMANGKVSIGDNVNTNTPDYDYGLYLWKGLLTERVKVAVRNTSQWADHVFEPGYALMPLSEVDRYIVTYGHLPNVPSAACVVEEGLDVAQTDAMLLEKIEELTLHVIALSKRIEMLERSAE